MNKDRFFFPALAILISSVCFAGFSFTYFGPIAGGSYPPAKAALHLHGWSFFLWYLLFPLQTMLISHGKYNFHRTLGRLSMLLVLIMTVTGIVVLTVRVEEATRHGGPQTWLLYGPLIFSNLVLFVSFYAAAVYMAVKRKIQAHKRLIIIASSIALGAGFFRLILHLSGFHPLSLPTGVLACSLFIVIGIVYDWLAHGKVHPVYWIGLGALFVVEGSLLPQLNSELVALVNERLALIGQHLAVLYQPHPTVEF